MVSSARTTLMPSLNELSALFEVLPEMPIPPPRQRHRPANVNKGASKNKPEANVLAIVPPWSPIPATAGAFDTLLVWLRLRAADPRETKPQSVVRPQNPFQALKAGKRVVVIAAVDAGMISFFRLGQGAFNEWPMV